MNRFLLIWLAVSAARPGILDKAWQSFFKGSQIRSYRAEGRAVVAYLGDTILIYNFQIFTQGKDGRLLFTLPGGDLTLLGVRNGDTLKFADFLNKVIHIVHAERHLGDLLGPGVDLSLPKIEPVLGLLLPPSRPDSAIALDTGLLYWVGGDEYHLSETGRLNRLLRGPDTLEFADYRRLGRTERPYKTQLRRADGLRIGIEFWVQELNPRLNPRLFHFELPETTGVRSFI